jgi:hypothetical protein
MDTAPTVEVDKTSDIDAFVRNSDVTDMLSMGVTQIRQYYSEQVTRDEKAAMRMSNQRLTELENLDDILVNGFEGWEVSEHNFGTKSATQPLVIRMKPEGSTEYPKDVVVMALPLEPKNDLSRSADAALDTSGYTVRAIYRDREHFDDRHRPLELASIGLSVTPGQKCTVEKRSLEGIIPPRLAGDTQFQLHEVLKGRLSNVVQPNEIQGLYQAVQTLGAFPGIEQHHQ